MKYVIGIDAGNWQVVPSFIEDWDPENDLQGGHPRVLEQRGTGYPAAFFYSDQAARKHPGNPPPWVGKEAVMGRASPARNRVRFFKQHLGEPLALDSWAPEKLPVNPGDTGKGTYNEAFTLLIQYVVRQANRELEQYLRVTTPLISLAYPVTMTKAHQMLMKQLAERATLEDGTPVQVVGMIQEPAAAALDFLGQRAATRDGETTVLVFDLGGGTTDLAILTAFPQGKQDADGQTFYYQLHGEGGLADLGGQNFDRALAGILRQKARAAAGENAGEAPPDDLDVSEEELLMKAEMAKKDLDQARSPEDSAEVAVAAGGHLYQVSVSLRELEEAVRPMLEQALQETRRVLQENKGPKPEQILLTGGAARMPLVARMLEEAFPGLPVYPHRYDEAVSFGAARYGTLPKESMKRLVRRDIGVKYIDDKADPPTSYIGAHIPRGTAYPFQTDWFAAFTLTKTRQVQISVYEGLVAVPDYWQVERDFVEILSVRLAFPHEVEEHTKLELRLSLDADGLLTVEGRYAEDHSVQVTNSTTVKNLGF